MAKPKTLEHTLAERQVLERLRGTPFLVNLFYAFQTDTKLHIVMGWSPLSPLCILTIQST